MRRFLSISGSTLLVLVLSACGASGCAHDDDNPPAPPSATTIPTEDAEAEIEAVRAGTIETDLQGLPTMASGDRLASLRAEMTRDNVLAYAKRIAGVWEIHGGQSESLSVRTIERDAANTSHARIDERIHDRRVVGGELIIHADAQGAVFMVNGHLASEMSAPPKEEQPKLDAKTAIEVAAAAIPAPPPPPNGTASAELVYVIAAAGDDTLRLAWAQTIRWDDAVDGGGQHHEEEIFADAADGVLLARHPKSHSALYREIYDAKGELDGPPAGIAQGSLMFAEGGKSSDAIATAAYDNVGHAWSFFKTKLGRDGMNGAGGKVRATVHLGQRFDNAFYTGITGGDFIAFGDGNGTFFGPFAKCLDIVAHEYTHGVTNHTAALVYFNDPGAINEAMSDIMGAAAEAHAKKGISAKTWQVGEDLIISPNAPPDSALRYMDDPKRDGRSCDWYPECAKAPEEDNGGVHARSGLANLAFKLMVTGGSHPRKKSSVVVPAIGLDDATKIFYTALTGYMTSSTDYYQARVATMEAAKQLFGKTSPHASAVEAAWNAVGTPRAGSVARQNGTTTLSSAKKGNRWVKYKLTVPYGAFDAPQWLEIFAWPAPDGDAKDNADIYVGAGTPPTTTHFTKRSRLGNYEYMRFDDVAPGDHYVWLYAPQEKGFTGVNLRATYGIDLGSELPEPNDTTVATFPVLPLQGGLVANESARGVTGLIDKPGDVDRFGIVIPPGKMLGVDLRVPPGKDYDLDASNADTGESLMKGELRVKGGSEHLNVRNSSTKPLRVVIAVSGVGNSFSTDAPYHLAANLLH